MINKRTYSLLTWDDSTVTVRTIYAETDVAAVQYAKDKGMIDMDKDDPRWQLLYGKVGINHGQEFDATEGD